MTNKIQSIKGMRDLIGDEAYQYEQLLKTIKVHLYRHGYHPFHPPILEETKLFSRSLGEGTDVVEKEMFTFDDHGDSLTLRPEATAGVMRAVIQNGLTFGSHKLWTAGPMFRRERPQKGRYRQFHQLSVEAVGIAEPEQDAEHLLMTHEIWKALGISDLLTLKINTLANTETRSKYRQSLVDYFNQYFEQLDEDSQRRLSKNPLRILDSKNPDMQSIIANAPNMQETLDSSSKNHFERVLACLKSANISYEIDSNLVRGLDYYNHTVYEWTTDQLGSQSAVCAGGRYDGLSEHLGSQEIPAVGFAIGLDRILLLMQKANTAYTPKRPLAYFILPTSIATQTGLILANTLRNTIKDAQIICNTSSQSIKNQLKKANQSNAHYAVIISDDELTSQQASIKNLDTGDQISIAFNQLNDYFYNIKKTILREPI